MKYIFLITIVLFSGSCVSSNKNNNKTIYRFVTDDYVIEIINNGKAAMILEYKGNMKSDVMIPPEIQELPVKKSETGHLLEPGLLT